MPKTKSILMRFHFLIILVHYAIASQAQRNVRRLSGASLSPSTNWTTSPTPNSFTHSPSVNLSYPSPSPTPECHDLLDYKSPINDLPCWAFRNTDCLAWTYIGLTDSQLFELLQSCPQACNVECRSTTNPSFSPSISYRTLVADVEFYVYGIRNPLDLDAKAVFEEVVRSFVSSAFTNGTSTIVSFTIDDQTMLHDRVKRLRKRRLSDATLRIYGKIVVRTIDETLTANSLKALFSSMIDSSAFQERVKNESILPELLVSSSFRIDIGGSPDIDQGTPTNKNPRKKALTITSIVLVMCSVILFVGFLYRKQTQSRYSEQLSPDVKLRYIFNDPEEIAWEDTTRPHHNHVSAFNFEDELDKVESEYIVQRNTTNEVNIDIQFPKSPRPESSERTHIPSMIIFDNIDDEKYLSPSERSRSSTNSHDEPTHQQSLEVNSVKMGMPVKRVDASSELMKVLSAKKIQNPNQAYSLLFTMKSSDEDDFRTNRSSDENSPKTLASSQLSTGEGASALSTPCCLKTGENSTSSANKRNNFTFDGSDTFAEEDFAVIFDKMTQSDKKKTISLRNLYLFKKKDDTEYENNQGSFSLHSHFESEDELSDESVNREEQERRDIDNVTFNPDYGTARKWSGTNEYYEQNQIAEQSINMNSKFCKVISSVSSPQKCDKYKTSSQQYRYTFEAPSTGKLGIIIAGSLHPTVHSVKSYSPLFGKVDVGDVIKSIDGESTLHMTISDITRLIDLRRSIATNGSQKIKITVMSNSPKPDLQNDIQLKVDENTEHGTFVERIEEFGATIQLSYSDDRDNSSCHLIGHLGEDDSSEDSGYLKNL